MKLAKTLRLLGKKMCRFLKPFNVIALKAKTRAKQETRHQAQKQQVALANVIAKIRASLDLNTIFATTTQETCQLLDVERVAVYRFYEDWSGEFINSFSFTQQDWNQLSPFGQKLVWEDTYLQETKGGRYRANESYAVADIYEAGHSRCHIDILEQFQIRAYAIAPIFHGIKLWGLLAAYQHRGPRQWQSNEVEFLAQVATHLGIATQQANLFNQLQIQTTALKKSVAHQRGLTEVVTKIRSVLDTSTIFQTTCQELLQLLDVQRVAVYRFHPDWSGEFVSSFGAMDTKWEHIAPFSKNLVWEDTYLQETKGGRYRQNETFTVADIYEAGHSRCHLDILEQFEIRAYGLAPIFLKQKLWGLLGIYQHSGPRQWQTTEVEMLAQTANHLGMAVYQAELLQDSNQQTNALQDSLKRQRALTEVVSKIRSSLDINWILQTTCEEACKLLKVERVGVYRFNLDWSGEFISHFGIAMSQWDSSEIPSKKLVWADTYLQETKGGRYRRNETLAVADIYKAGHSQCYIDILEQFKIRAYAIAPILVGQKLWGLLAAYQHAAPYVWDQIDVEFLAQIGTQVGVAIQSAKLLSESQIKAEDLQKAAEQRQILFEVVAKIRESLDLATIFKITAQEVRKFLKADRVGIFQFEPDSDFCQGEFVSESVSPQFRSATTHKVHDQCFGEKFAIYYAKGRIQVLSDIYQADLKDCHIEILEQFQIQAQIIVPLLKQSKLWGLLCIHQCSQTRQWKETEIEFVRQVAAQLDIALQQTELLTQTRDQAKEIATTLENLQRTQLQIVQSEKMASLGQLVAGVAHEINNPINFIYGNLTHVKEYSDELLNLVQLYQKHCPTPAIDIQKALEKADLNFLIEDLFKVIQSMQTGTERIREIVLSLRNFSRLDEAELKQVNIHQGLDSTLMILSHRLKAGPDSPGIAVQKDYGKLPAVECYPGQLNQVFMNLFANAIDALEERHQTKSSEEIKTNPSLIQVSTKLIANNWVSIHIADNGPGIPKAIQERLFEPFFTTKTVGKGTGLGLSISYQIITEKHKGKLFCDSTPESGTEFIIEIPVSQA